MDIIQGRLVFRIGRDERVKECKIQKLDGYYTGLLDVISYDYWNAPVRVTRSKRQISIVIKKIGQSKSKKQQVKSPFKPDSFEGG